MGVIICDKTKNKEKKVIEANTKIDGDKNSTKETEMIKESEIDDYLDLNLR